MKKEDNKKEDNKKEDNKKKIIKKKIIKLQENNSFQTNIQSQNVFYLFGDKVRSKLELH